MIRIDSAQVGRDGAVASFSLDFDCGSLNDTELDNLRQFLAENRDANVILNLFRTRNIGASFLDILAQASGRGCVLSLVGLNGLCKEVLETAKLDGVFDVFRTHQEAVEAISTCS